MLMLRTRRWKFRMFVNGDLQIGVRLRLARAYGNGSEPIPPQRGLEQRPEPERRWGAPVPRGWSHGDLEFSLFRFGEHGQASPSPLRPYIYGRDGMTVI